MNETTPPKFYTVQEVARILRTTARQITARIRAKRLLAIKPAGAKEWLIPETALKDYINAGANL